MSDASSDQFLSWRTLWQQTADALGDRIHARWMCEVASSMMADEFLANLDEFATTRSVSHLDAMVARRRAGEPLQYVLGQWPFRHLDLAVDARVLIPRPETELVAEVAIDAARLAGPIRTVVDMGTGSGAIGLALASELPLDGTTVWLTDSSSDAVDVARANLAGIGPAARNVRIVAGSWFDALPDGVVADVIVSNPPYVADQSPDIEASVIAWEPPSALFAGADGLDDIQHIVAGALGHLRPGGSLVIEIGADQGDAVTALLDSAGFVDIEVRPDLAGLDRIAVARRATSLFDIDVEGFGRLSLRHLRNEVSDYAHLLAWLTTDEVLEWYAGRDQDYDLADILDEYGPGSESEQRGTISAIAELDDDPIGYVQLYELAQHADEFGLGASPDAGVGAWSLDLFIGDPTLHGKGLGRRLVRACADFLLVEFGAKDVMIMPYPENARAIAAYRAAGFVDGPVIADHEIHEGTMRDGLRMHYRPNHPPVEGVSVDGESVEANGDLGED